MQKKLSKILSVFLAVLMMVSVVPITAGATTVVASGTCGEIPDMGLMEVPYEANLKWTLDNNGTLIIYGTGAMGDFYDWSCPWDSYSQSIKNVIVEEGVNTIGAGAFNDFCNLTGVTIANSVTSIGHNAFYNCDSLHSVTLPTNITKVSYSAFAYCSSLSDIIIPDTACGISDSAFSGTAYYNNVDNWENGVLYIGNHLLSAQRSLSGEYMIKDSTRTISPNAFSLCYNLTNIIIPDSVTDIGANAFTNTEYYNNSANWENGVLYNGKHLIAAKTDISGNYIIRNNTKTIAANAFYDCKALTAVTLPETVISIGESAFSGCGISKIIIPSAVTIINDSVFSRCAKLASVTIPETVSYIGDRVFSNCIALENIVLPDSVKSIGSFVFWACNSLASINIPNSVTSIGIYAFYNCTALKNIALSESLSNIVSCVFENCNSLITIKIPATVTSIGISAFEGCGRLVNIDIPDTVKTIAYSAFSYCNSLTDVYYAGSEEDWGAITIGENNEDLLNATIHYNFLDDEPIHQHSYTSEITKEATCMAPGIKTYTCACTDTYTEEIAKIAHKFSTEFTVDKEATFTEAGSKSKHCTGAGCTEKTEVTVIPKLEAPFKDSDTAKVSEDKLVMTVGNSVSQLLSQAGAGAVIKDSKGNVLSSDKLPGTGMTLILPDGKEHTIVVFGDVEGDGKISAADARLTLRASVGLEDYKENSAQYKAANVSSADKLSATDARFILRASVNLENPKSWMK